MIKGSDWGGSRLATAQTCKAKYNYRYNVVHPDGGIGLVQIEDKMAPAKGTLLHTCLQAYYDQLIKDPKGDKSDYAVKAIMKMLEQIKEFKFDPPVVELLQQELIAAADQYFAHYAVDDIEPIATEVPVEVEYKGHNGEILKHTGIIDLVAKWYGGSLFITDHKTTSMGFAMLFKKYTFSLSFKGYCKAATPKFGAPVGVLVNAIRFKKNKALEVELEREPIMYTEKELDEFEPTVKSIRREIEMCEKDNFWPKSAEQCVQVWGECEYMKICKYPDPGMIAGMYKGAK